MLDDKDENILSILSEDASLSVKQVSKLMGLPITTTHNRIKRLKSSGVIRKYTIKIDKQKRGKSISAFILADFDYEQIRKAEKSPSDLAKQILMMDDVSDVNLTTGRKDMVVKVHTKDMEELKKIVYGLAQEIPGIVQTETFVILR